MPLLSGILEYNNVTLYKYIYVCNIYNIYIYIYVIYICKIYIYIYICIYICTYIMSARVRIHTYLESHFGNSIQTRLDFLSRESTN